METLWRLIVGGFIGAIAGMISSRDIPMGFIGNIIAGLVGSSLGESVFGTWGPIVAGMALVPSILGAVILVFITSLLFRGMKR